jgi:hypothetical protein
LVTSSPSANVSVLARKRRGSIWQPEWRVGVEGVAPGLALAVPVRFGGARGHGNRQRRLARPRLILSERGDRRRRRRRRAAAAATARDDRRQRAWRPRIESTEVHLLDRHVRRAAIGDHHRHADGLAWHDDAVIGQRFDAHAVGQQNGLLKLALLLAQAEVDLETPALVDRQVPKLRAQSTNGAKTGHERLQRRAGAFGGEPTLRILRGRLDRGSPSTGPRGGGVKLRRPATEVSAPAKSNRSSRSSCPAMVDSTSWKVAGREPEGEQRPVLALVHAAGLGADLG